MYWQIERFVEENISSRAKSLPKLRVDIWTPANQAKPYF